MIDLSNEAKRQVAQAAQADSLLGNGQLAYERQAWCNGLAGLSQAGEEVNSAALQQGPFLAGGLGQNVAANLLQRLRTYRCDVWRFMTDKDELFTKNLAGQVLRKPNVKQNISGGFRTAHGTSMFFFDSLLSGNDAQTAGQCFVLSRQHLQRPACAALLGWMN
ncbi:MAG: hypothetical protein H7228_12595 [Polaromonas sp.]|nr:hypothetical protein [Polaromonas sp.]